MAIKNDWGLVLAGGGGKGAYEIGVWKALMERKDLHISAVSGTSVGALNGALFSTGDFELAQAIWEDQINEEVILTPKHLQTPEFIELLENVLKESEEWIADLPELPKAKVLPGQLLKAIIGKQSVLHKLETVLEQPLAESAFWLIRQMAKRGVFTRDGLIQIVRQNQILPRVKNSMIPCYVTCYNIMSHSAECFQLQQYTDEKMLELLLASSALPFIFPPVDIDGTKYWDGGLKENVPISPLYDIGYRKLLVVHLERQDNHLFYDETPVFQKQICTPDNREQMHCCDAVLVHFYPQKSLSGFQGTLDFNPKTIRRKMEQGYKETRKRLERVRDILD